jgi:hypothetical protein
VIDEHRIDSHKCNCPDLIARGGRATARPSPRGPFSAAPSARAAGGSDCRPGAAPAAGRRELRRPPSPRAELDNARDLGVRVRTRLATRTRPHGRVSHPRCTRSPRQWWQRSSPAGVLLKRAKPCSASVATRRVVRVAAFARSTLPPLHCARHLTSLTPACVRVRPHDSGRSQPCLRRCFRAAAGDGSV